MKKNLIGLLFSGRGKLKKLLLTMKLTSILVLFFTLQISASVYSQSTKFNYDFRGKTVREVFNIIESNSHFRFFFNDDFKYIDEVVNLKVSDNKVEDILDKLFSNTDITYRVLETILR